MLKTERKKAKKKERIDQYVVVPLPLRYSGNHLGKIFRKWLTKQNFTNSTHVLHGWTSKLATLHLKAQWQGLEKLSSNSFDKSNLLWKVNLLLKMVSKL